MLSATQSICESIDPGTFGSIGTIVTAFHSGYYKRSKRLFNVPYNEVCTHPSSDGFTFTGMKLIVRRGTQSKAMLQRA
jgi:hypothetical protein